MGFTEEKNKRILELQEEVKRATKEVAKYQASTTATQNLLQKRSERYDQAEKDSVTAHTNYKLSQTASATANTVHDISEVIKTNTQDLMNKSIELVNQAYAAAEQAVKAATAVANLADHVEKTKSKNKLISDLLVADAKKSTTDASKAVNDAIAAYNDALTAANVAIHLKYSVAEMDNQIEAAIKDLGDDANERGKSIVHDLKNLYEGSNKKTEAALLKKNEAQQDLNKVSKSLALEQNKLSTATLALNAANAAVAQS